jgi:DNA polymerase III delta subunit
MLIIKIGTRLKKRVECEDYIKSLEKNLSSFDVVILKKDELSGVPQYFDTNIFGDTIKVKLEDWNTEEYRDHVYKYLDKIQESKNIFIIDELEMLEATFKKISKYAEKVFDAREKEIKDSPFLLADYIYAGNKKAAWLEYNRLLSSGEAVESIAGVINWKLKSSRLEKHKYINFKIMRAVAMDHDGLCNAEKEVEGIILKI